MLLGSIMTTVDRVSIMDGRHKPSKRGRASSCRMHHGFIVCKITYAFIIIQHWNCHKKTGPPIFSSPGSNHVKIFGPPK